MAGKHGLPMARRSCRSFAARQSPHTIRNLPRCDVTSSGAARCRQVSPGVEGAAASFCRILCIARLEILKS
jgi:hypothetical protein